MLGTYQVDGEVLRFSPRFPFMEGRSYGVRCTLDGCIAETFTIPRRAAAPTRVTQIFPSADLLPENLLRFYIHFSAQMREGEALRHIHLQDSDGQEVAGAFLDTLEELWDKTGTRLTLLFDPGRVKTGLLAHEHLGRALCAGRGYRLVIDRTWRDARGEPLLTAAEKTFTAAPARMAPLHVSRWQLLAPPAGTLAPLSIRFPEPLDHGGLLEFVRVHSADGALLQGQILLERAETVWRFVPESPWVPGRYGVHIDKRLEDPAGNNLFKPFDGPTPPASPDRTASLEFEVQ
jgi:hypothetical protein